MFSYSHKQPALLKQVSQIYTCSMKLIPEVSVDINLAIIIQWHVSFYDCVLSACSGDHPDPYFTSK